MTVATELFDRAVRHGNSVAITDSQGKHTYAELLARADGVARVLLAGTDDLGSRAVCFYVPPSFQYAAIQWGIWRAGGIALPLRINDPDAQHRFRITDSQAGTVVAPEALRERLSALAAEAGARFVSVEECMAGDGAGLARGGDRDPSRFALMLYTSGTTGRPKGVVTTHGNIQAQIESLVEAWEWTSNDRIPLFLPLDHIHGAINILSCALWSGATCDILGTFDPAKVWERVRTQDYTLFMAVPDIYTRLINVWERAEPGEQREMTAACKAMRLMVSGSAALPVPRLHRWQEVSGHVLLERYGMTEIGMGLSNPLQGERRPGFVGQPLPKVKVRLLDDDFNDAPPGEAGEIAVSGPLVFAKYWDRPKETAESFHDGWFLTGDVGRVVDGYYQILGRKSQDIIKSGGEKVSALEIEPVLLRHPRIRECAVVGLPDERFGEAVSAAVVTVDGEEITREEVRKFARQYLTIAAVPLRVVTVPELPKNNMGKVVKPEVKKLFPER